ncbi:hypothetical protein H0H92_006098 [Tricholoma furcatifolium]|nr:hypothetical protein H0H92_006098 [Tricholoma furcatifolium]
MLILGLVCAISGAFIHRWTSVDPRDPRVREAVLLAFNNKVQHYEQQAREWKYKAEHFEEEWKAKLEKEERQRKRARLYWGEFVGAERCVSSGHRRYSARLWNLTPDLEAIDACKSTRAVINGISYDSPASCENWGSHGVYGYWIAANEPMCASYWEHISPKDCTAPGSGLRQYTGKLNGVYAHDDRDLLCLTTPAMILNNMFDRTDSCTCPFWGIGGCWGVWNIPDDSCR